MKRLLFTISLVFIIGFSFAQNRNNHNKNNESIKNQTQITIDDIDWGDDFESHNKEYYDSIYKERQKNSRSPRPKPFTESLKHTDFNSFHSQDFTQEALAAGFGSSKYDKNIQFYPGINLKEARERERKREIEEKTSNAISIGFILVLLILLFIGYAILNKKEKEGN